MVKLIHKSPKSLRILKLNGMGVYCLKNCLYLHNCVPDLEFDKSSLMHVKTRKFQALRMMGGWVNVY